MITDSVNNTAKEFIFEEGAYFRSCHAVTLLSVGNGLMAAWFAGTYETHSDTAVWGAIRSENGWGAPRMLVKACDEPHWNPVLFRLSGKRIVLFFKVGFEIPSWRTYMIESCDEGCSWSQPQEMIPGDVSGGRGPVKNKPILLADGTILAPGSTECNNQWRAFVDSSRDKGASWQRSGSIGNGDMQIIQPALWESSPGNVHMLLRSQSGFAARSDSADGGKTWSIPQLSTLPNNNSGLDAVWIEDREMLLVVCNPDSRVGRRTPLALMGSRDNGKSWKELLIVEDEDVFAGDIKALTGGEFSYPAIIRDRDMIWLGYTWHRRRIAVLGISVEELDRLW